MQEQFYKPLHNIEISPIVRIAEQARKVETEYQERTGSKFIHLERGELNLATPQLLIDNIKKSLDEGKTKYPKSGGELLFKEQLVKKLQNKNKIPDITPNHIIVTAGGQEALNMSFSLFTNQKMAGFSPIWSVAVENFVPYSNVEFLEVPLNKDFTIDWQAFERVLPEIKVFYLNNPQNPSGKVFTCEELSRIISSCKKFNVFIISDEAYEDVIFDGTSHISTMSVSDSFDYPDIITAFTFSKSFSATGIRVGYTVSKNPTVNKLLNGMQYTHTAGVPTFLQYGLSNFLDVDLSQQQIEFQKRRDLFYNGLKDIPGMKTVKPNGAFYFYPNVSEGMKKYPNRDVLDVLMENGLCVVPGWGFTKHGHFLDNIRISYSAVNLDDIRVACDRFRQLFS
jgi:aspartate aminotransferase